MSPSVSLLVLLYAAAAAALLLAGLSTLHIFVLVTALSVLAAGIAGSAVFVGLQNNPAKALDMQAAMPDMAKKLQVTTSPANAVFYCILAVATTNPYGFAAFAFFALSSAFVWFTRQDD